MCCYCSNPLVCYDNTQPNKWSKTSIELWDKTLRSNIGIKLYSHCYVPLTINTWCTNAQPRWRTTVRQLHTLNIKLMRKRNDTGRGNVNIKHQNKRSYLSPYHFHKRTQQLFPLQTIQHLIPSLGNRIQPRTWCEMMCSQSHAIVPKTQSLL